MLFRPAYSGILLLLFCYPLYAQTEYYGYDQLCPLLSGESKFITLPGGTLVQENDSFNGFLLGDHLVSSRVLINDANTIRSALTYDPYGKTPVTVTGFNFTGTYSWNDNCKLYATPTRRYHPYSKRFLQIDPYRQTPAPYSYVAANPVNYADPGGAVIFIVYSEGAEEKLMHYKRERLVDYSEHQSDFLRHTLFSLDYLFDTKATKIKYLLPGGSGDEEVHMLERLMSAAEINIRIINDFELAFFRREQLITYNPLSGIKFRKDRQKAYTPDNTGYNTPTAGLGHELVHAYRYNFDRKNELSALLHTYHNHSLGFPDEDERIVTLDYANQINRNLQEDVRNSYFSKEYKTLHPLLTVPHFAMP